MTCIVINRQKVQRTNLVQIWSELHCVLANNFLTNGSNFLNYSKAECPKSTTYYESMKWIKPLKLKSF